MERLGAQCEEVGPRRKPIDEGKPCQSLFVLRPGRLAEFKQLRNGSRHILNSCLPGDIVGFECLTYTTAPHSVASLAGCEIASFPSESFERIQREFPRLATAFFPTALRETTILREREVGLGWRPAFARVAGPQLLLDRKLHIRGFTVRDGDAVPFPLTRQEIADRSGLSLPYVNRTPNEMRDAGFIRPVDRKPEVFEQTGLAKAADFSTAFVENRGRGWLGQSLRETTTA